MAVIDCFVSVPLNPGSPQHLVVATAAPALPVPAATEAEEVRQMCQQLRQCVGACQLSGAATTSGRVESDESEADISPMQVRVCGHCLLPTPEGVGPSLSPAGSHA